MAQRAFDLDGATVLVTGGAGFIGSHLADGLRAAGARVRILDDLSTGNRANVADEHEVVVGSILDDAALARATDGAEIVYHLAAMVSVPQSVAEPERCFDVNVSGTARVLEAARSAGARRVVFASSAAVYGDRPNLPSRERDPVDCRSPYAASKAAGEALLGAWTGSYDLETVALRYFNIFGPRQAPDSAYAAAIAAFADAARAGRPATIFGDGRQTRDFTSVENVVHANILAGRVADPGPGPINVGTGDRVTLLDVEARCRAIAGSPAEPNFGPSRPGDVTDSGPDLTRARKRLGYAPIVDLDEGLRRLMTS